MPNIDNTKTIVDAPIWVVKNHLDPALKQLDRAYRVQAAKHGPDHAIAKGYKTEIDTLERMIQTMKQA